MTVQEGLLLIAIVTSGSVFILMQAVSRHNIRERKRMEDALQFVAQHGWTANGEQFLPIMTQYLGKTLGMDYVIADKLAAATDIAETVALFAKGNILPNMQYSLKGTPCENVMEGRMCCYVADVQQQFPDDVMLAEMGVESYVGLPLWDSAGNVIGLIAVMDGKPISDGAAVTELLQLMAVRAAAELERAQSEQALRAREQEFRALAENSPDPIFRYDRECRRIYVNPAVERLTGKPAAILLQGTPADAAVAASREGLKLIQCIQEVLATGQPVELETEFVTSDEVLHYFHNRYVPEWDDDGMVASVLCVCRDITERKKVEELLRAREQELRTLLKNLPDCVVRHDLSGRRIFTNVAYERAVGIQSGMAHNKSPAEFWYPTNITAAKYTTILRRVMETGESAEVLLEWPDKSGNQVSMSIHLAAEFDANGAIVGALSLGRNISHLRRQERLEQVRLRIFEMLAQGGELTEVFTLVTEFMETANPAFLCSILLLSADGKHLLTGAAPRLPADYIAAIHGIAIGEGVGSCGTAAWRGEAVCVEDVRTHPYWANYRELAVNAGLLACWSFPVIDAAGKVLATFAIYRHDPGLPSDDDLVMIREACHLSLIAIERKYTEEKMQRQASYDALTGLPNRRLFGNRLREEIIKSDRSGENVALLFIDLDHFKDVNDTLGHEVGDQLLLEASQRIQHSVRESDTVARLGGDEFVVVLPEVADIAHLGQVAQSVIDSLTQPFQLARHAAHISASIGIASYPMDADSADVLVGCADKAMYAAKEQGRNSFSFFTTAMQAQAEYRLHMASDLRRALSGGQLEVHYQPIVNIMTGEVVKAEALLRWRHPTQGMISPAQFIPVAEETGAIHSIGDWVFREAAATAARWAALLGLSELERPCQIGVNMSPRQITKGGHDNNWIDHLRTIGLHPRHMAIEITEGLLLHDRPDVMAKLEQFRAVGMQLSLDDFGTGYSAMAYLKKFNIDYLKIDRSFVRDLETDPNDCAIAEAIVVMAHRLGIKVIAEGVETTGQRDLLAAVGCEYVQGYLYARPMPADDFFAYVGARQDEHSIAEPPRTMWPND